MKIAQLPLGVASLENDAEASYSWDYAAVLWNGVCTEKVREAFAKLSFREQTLLEKRSAICMTCGRVSPLSERVSFEDLAIEFAVFPIILQRPAEVTREYIDSYFAAPWRG